MIKRIKYMIHAVTALLFGLILYILFRPESYITGSILNIFHIKPDRIAYDGAILSFLSFYFADFLWCYSLAIGLCAIFVPCGRGRFHCCLLAFGWGVIWELGQMAGVIGGTADILDVLMYLLAACTCYILK